MANAFAEIDAFWETPFEVCPEDEPRQQREFVRYATLAPNAHNTQAWQFALSPGVISLFPDYTRGMPHGDPGNRELWISLGCALEHLLIAARHVGYTPDVDYFPPTAPEESIVVRFRSGKPEADDTYFNAIPRRHSNRNSYDGRPIPTADLAALSQVIAQSGVQAHVLTDPCEVERIIAVVKQGFAWQRSSKAFQDELYSWIRFSPSSIAGKRDGLSSRALGRPQIPDAIGRFLVKVLAITGLEEKEIVGKIRGSSAVLVLTTNDNDRLAWVRAGQSLARIKLQATALGISCAHLNNNLQWEATKAPMRRAIALGNAHPQVAIRLGYAAPLPHAPRRAVEDVLRQ